MKYLLKSAHVVDPQAELDGIFDVLIQDDKIKEVSENLEADSATDVIDCQGYYLIPGLVDAHVHFRDPGYEYKETIETGCMAATKGGFTDVATMPNTLPVCDTGSAVRYQIDRAREVGLARVHPIGALTVGEKGEALAEIGDMYQAGAAGFSDDGRGVQSAGMMRTCMEYVSMFNRCIMPHCQDESLAGKGVVNEGRASTRLGLMGWPALAEEIEISRDIDLCRLTGCPLHIQHISTARGLELIRAAKAEGLPVTCEVTPHHLFLTEENITDSYNTNLKVNPPLRTFKDAQTLREGVVDGSVDIVVTDHAPHSAYEKDCEFEIASFGSVGLETSLPLIYDHMVRKGEISMARLVEIMAIRPREILRMDKVSIQPGYTADITIVDPDRDVAVNRQLFAGRSYNSAFMGQRLTGQAVYVFVAGRPTLIDGKVFAKED